MNSSSSLRSGRNRPVYSSLATEWVRPEIQLITAVAELALELSECLVFLVADSRDGHIELDADLRNRPATHPELDDPILARCQYGAARGFEDFSQFELISLATIEIGGGSRRSIERLEPLGALNSLPHHVDGPDQLPAVRRVLRQNLRQVELSVPRLGEKTAADFLGAVIPEPGIKPGIAPADRAIALNVANQIRFGRLSGERSQSRSPRPRPPVRLSVTGRSGSPGRSESGSSSRPIPKDIRRS